MIIQSISTIGLGESGYYTNASLEIMADRKDIQNLYKDFENNEEFYIANSSFEYLKDFTKEDIIEALKKVYPHKFV